MTTEQTTAPRPAQKSFREWGGVLSNWGRWGHDDVLGTLNLITPARRAAAAQLVRSGVSIPLGLEFNSHGPQPESGERRNPVHIMTRTGALKPTPSGYLFTDDLVVMYLQCATQIDALAHVAYDGLIYNNHSVETVTPGGAEVMGIENFKAGIQGRGVLLDLPRYFGVDRLRAGQVLTVSDIEGCLKSQRVSVEEGDILLFRTGWIRVFLEDGDREAYLSSEPGIGLEVAQWLHSKDVAFVASDNYGVEVVPPETPDDYPLHCVLIRDMGMSLGEMFDLEALAAHCQQTERWEFFFSCLPIPVTGGVGAPVAPIATF
jgi:kynurenine formamidase